MTEARRRKMVVNRRPALPYILMRKKTNGREDISLTPFVFFLIMSFCVLFSSHVLLPPPVIIVLGHVRVRERMGQRDDAAYSAARRAFMAAVSAS